MEERFQKDPQSFFDTTINEFPQLKRRIDKRLSLPWVYGDTLNWMRGIAYMLHEYIGPERLRLVELVRHPVATCRSMMADADRSVGSERSDIGLAEETAEYWVRHYSWIRHQFQAINSDALCKTIRLEDTSLDRANELYRFLELDGFDEAAVTALLDNTTKDVRHFHTRKAHIPASKEELRAAWEICGPLAAEYGYREDEAYYIDAPSRPARAASKDTPPTGISDSTEARPASVKLLDNRGLGLIVKCPSGVRYSNQSGGPICFWLNAEGAFVPLAARGKSHF